MGLSVLADIYVPTFEMTVDYLPLPIPIARQVMNITVQQNLAPPNSFRFTLNDPKLALIDSATGIFTEGTRIEISMGFVGKTIKSLIVGEITAVTADFSSSGPTTVEVEGMDLLHRLSRGTTYRRWDGATPDAGLPDSEIVSALASEANLVPDVGSTSPPSPPRVQRNESNMNFVKRLAILNGYYLWVDGNTLHFQPDRPSPSSLSLDWGKTLMSFTARLSTAGQVQSVEARGWDPAQKQSVSATAQRSGDFGVSLSANGEAQLAIGSGGQSNLLITDASIASVQEAQDYAQAVMDNQQQTLVTGQGTSVGQPETQVASTLQLNGVRRFNGTYIVQQATHSLGAGGYQTSFEVRQKP
jgi:uncharacterized protein